MTNMLKKALGVCDRLGFHCRPPPPQALTLGPSVLFLLSNCALPIPSPDRLSSNPSFLGAQPTITSGKPVIPPSRLISLLDAPFLPGLQLTLFLHSC